MRRFSVNSTKRDETFRRYVFGGELDVSAKRLYGGLTMTLFKEKYRIESARRPGWDYSAAGYYFVTLCTKNRIRHFGRVVNGDLELTPVGEE